MRHYRVQAPYIAPEQYERIRTCIRRRCVQGPWRKVYVQQLRAKQQAKLASSPSKAAPSSDTIEDEAAKREKAARKADSAQLDKDKELEVLEAKLQELIDQKHAQFKLLKAILMDEKMSSRLPPQP
ncbi:hypothetical protein SDRG_03122 [Saprolegnia diclina VS20]|uniref:Uncharacterized protein n=1 Tax=Saprolegnia diclina (strain VS20) TaxID=1156394 RepID=T0QNL7_SAPDV|nr:hypothetical protein SDRG_03122 [Saprolegnia diclina VS20]EQC39694.1 hypothetical protein SDRG_03122 [Saprolegnia diclina VS20]|eukprot:XP_008606966.1 hypothetical protein SDRG_03122 [Saprolegnia diclina VS20]